MTALSPAVSERAEVPPDIGVLSKVLEARDPAPNFQNVAVCNSSDVHFGHKTIIHGPVTIVKQFNDESDEARAERNERNAAEEPSPEWAWKGVKWVHKRPGVTLTGVALLGGTLLVCLLLALLLPGAPGSKGGARSGVGEWNENNNKNIPIPTNIDSVLLVPNHLRMISRQEWLAQPPAGLVDPMESPVPMVIITHTATENCSSQAACVFQVRTMQTYHIESRSWSDIGYNFLVGGDGAAYEGRGWNGVGAHTKGYNLRSVGIAFIGTFNDVLPPERQIEACKQLLEQGVQQGKLTKDYKLFGHRQLIASLSPGEVLFNEISKWPHFSKEI